MASNKHDAAHEPETTGHEWDGIRELNKPLPKWWLYTFYACIVWAIGYWLLMPAWPLVTSYTKGMLGYSQREVVAEQIEAAKAAKTEFRQKIAASDLAAINSRPRAAPFRARRRRGSVRRQLRALSRQRRARRVRLSQSPRQFLAVGRFARRHPSDHHPWHQGRRYADAEPRHADAGVRQDRRLERGADRRRR